MTILGLQHSFFLHFDMADETILRDELAKDRTKLANERTLLAYGRTALAALIGACFVFKFMPTVWGLAIGFSILIVAGAIVFMGVRNYRAISARITDLYQPSNGRDVLDGD